LVRRTRHALGSLLQNPAPHGLRELPPTETPKHPDRALLPFTSRTKHDLESLADPRPTPASEDTTGLPFADDPPMRFGDPPAYQVSSSDQHRSYLLQLRGALRLSQPLDALLRSCTLPALFRAGDAHGLFAFRGFPPPVASSASPRARKRARVTTLPLLRAVFPVGRICVPKDKNIRDRSRLQGCEHPPGPFSRAGVTRFSASRSSLGVSPSRS
jgi:hypothetical protein